MEIWTHMLEEMALRHGPWPNGFTRDIFHSEPFPDLVGELGTKPACILASRGLRSNEVLTKFGKAEHMQDLVERGAMRRAPSVAKTSAGCCGAFPLVPGAGGVMAGDAQDEVLYRLCQPCMGAELESHGLPQH